MTPEAKARQQIDERLAQAGWVVQDMKQLNLGASLGVALHLLATQQQPLSETDRARLVEIRQRLEGLDFNFASRDRLEQEYLRARFDLAADSTVDGAVG